MNTKMNSPELDIMAQATPRSILYFQFRPHLGSAIQQVEYDLLLTNLSLHRGYADSAADLCRDDYWAVVATSKTGMGADAVAYTTDYLRSMPVVDESSITTTPPAPSQS